MIPVAGPVSMYKVTPIFPPTMMMIRTYEHSEYSLGNLHVLTNSAHLAKLIIQKGSLKDKQK